MAAAEVTIGGLGRFGAHYDEENKVKDLDDVNLTSRLRLQIDMSTQSDAGIEFGGRFRTEYNQNRASANAPTVNGGRLYASMGPVTLQVGNISGAVDSMNGILLPTTSAGTGVNFMDAGSVLLNSVDAYKSGEAGTSNGVELIYNMADLGVHISASDGTDKVPENIAAHVSYSISGWTLAVGGQDTNDEDGQNVVIATVTGDLGFANVGAAFGRNEMDDTDVDKVRLYGHVPVGMATELVIWGADEDKNPDGDGGSFGIDVEHHLGGGVTAVAGFSDSAIDDGAQASAGVFFKF